MAFQPEILPQQREFVGVVREVQDYSILLLSPDGYVLSWNAGAQRIQGYSSEQILGQHFSKFYPEEALQRGWPDYELKVAAEKGRFEDEGWRVRSDGTQFWANVVITPWRDDSGNLLGFLKITRDMTARKEAEEKVEEFTRKLQSSNRELEQFASVAAHDLQEPLRKIQAFSERLQRKTENLDEQSKDYLKRIVNSAGRMRDLINDLLAYSRVRTKAQPFEPVNLNEIATAVISDLEGRLQQTGGAVESEELPTIDADPMQMRQLFTNLIGNALKFRRPETAPVVHITAGTDEDRITLAFADNGIGFDEIYLDRIFDVFQRLHGRQEYEGTGMGLAICRKIVDRHAGTITAKSQPDQGSTFIVTLPRVQQERKAA